MNDSCRQWETWIEAGGFAEEEPARDRHLQSCPICREQWSAHLAFSELARVPPPALSPDLAVRVRRAIVAVAAESMLSPRGRHLMRLYWLVSTFAAGLILAQLGAAPAGWLLFSLCLGILGLASLPALVLLRRRFSWGLMDLLVWTFG